MFRSWVRQLSVAAVQGVGVVLLVGVMSYACFPRNNPVARLQSNGVIVDIYPLVRAQKIKRFETEAHQIVVIDGRVVKLKAGVLSIDGRVRHKGEPAHLAVKQYRRTFDVGPVINEDDRSIRRVVVPTRRGVP